MGGLTRERTAEPVSRDQILRRERVQGKLVSFPLLSSPQAGLATVPVDAQFAERDEYQYTHIYIYIYIYTVYNSLYVSDRKTSLDTASHTLCITHAH